jgi:MFS family permease
VTAWFLQIVTLALGVAASPLPAVAILVALLTRRARLSSVTMLAGWVLGVVFALAIAIAFAGRIQPPGAGLDLWWEGAFSVLLGVGLLMTGILSRRARKRASVPLPPPAWIKSVDNLSPVAGAVVVFLNATTSPKNLALAITAGRVLVSKGTLATQAPAVVLYVAIASLTIALPVFAYFVGGERSTAVIERWKRSVEDNAAVVMEIMLLVLGFAMTARGIYNLLG